MKEIEIWLNWKHWWETVKWLLFTVLGSLLPVWGSWFLLRLFSQEIRWIDFFKDGEFALYSAALIAPALYLILKENFKIPFLQRHLCGFLAFFFLICSLLIFSAVTALSANESLGKAVILNESFLVKTSITIFALTVILVFFVKLGDDLTAEGIYKLKQKAAEELEKNFTALGEENE